MYEGHNQERIVSTALFFNIHWSKPLSAIHLIIFLYPEESYSAINDIKMLINGTDISAAGRRRL